MHDFDQTAQIYAQDDLSVSCSPAAKYFSSEADQ